MKPVLVYSLSHYLQGFCVSKRWLDLKFTSLQVGS